MAYFDIYVSDDCPHCKNLKQSINFFQKKGNFNCSVQYRDANRNNKVKYVPAIYKNGKEFPMEKFVEKCISY